MAERPVFHPELGAYFVQLRERKGWGQRQAAQIAAKRKLAAINHQVLLRLEHGRVRHPDAEVLRQVAALYGEAYETIARRWFAAEYGVDSSVAERELQRAEERDRERTATDEDEWWWLQAWRQLSEAARATVKPVVVLALAAPVAVGAGHPPPAPVRRRSAG